ncbi:MAG TPA: DUF3095 domain-containing protein, partial [Hyphomonadaceae bacterium]
MLQVSPNGFYTAVPPFTLFSEVTEPRHYRRLPDDWLVGVADIINSTGAIARGEYKAVNMVGASIISALINALGHRDFPFVFGGDGAAFALPESEEQKVRATAAAVQRWANEEMGLDLRVALIPLEHIRRAQHDVLVARFAVAPELAYAMFSGGGIAWAEDQMKRGHYAVEPASAGTQPDLTGLSCRWEPIDAERGEIVSVLILPQPATRPQDFANLIESVTGLLGGTEAARPAPERRLRFTWPAAGLEYEVRAMRGKGSYYLRYAERLVFTLFAWVLFRFGISFGGFDPALYRADAARNSDFRKFDDGLKLTLDIDERRVEELARVLEEARRRGNAFYGLHRQSQALMTCIVPSPLMRDHLHFIDGAGGGYAKAAEVL